MSKAMSFIDWLRPFHEAANGATSEAIEAALADFDAAPEPVRTYVIRQGLRLGLHALRRTSAIQVNGDAETVPLFFATTEPDGQVVHRARSLATVEDARTQLSIWKTRASEADREVSWWAHQLDLASTVRAPADETLASIWNRLGLSYQLFIGEPSGEEGAA